MDDNQIIQTVFNEDTTTKISKILKEIENTKRKLKEKAQDKGVYENFGQKEVRALKDKYIDLSDYSSNMNQIRRLLDGFDDWCSNFTGNLRIHRPINR
jgi:hypothetical protein